jgi:hypothetical protein
MLRDRVAGHPAVPEQECALGRDDVRGVRDHEVELLPRDRLEEAAEPRLDVPGAVEGCVEGRVLEGPRVDVGGDDVLGVRGKQDRLDPVAGAQIERSLAAAANGQVRERD